MKVLILSCSTGQGHNAAGMAMYETFTSMGVPCKMLDSLSFTHNTKVSGIVCKTYIDTTTHIPGFFGLLYELGGTISSSRYKSPVYLANIVFAQRLYKYVIKNNIDTLIVPHLFPAETITYIKRNFPNFDNVKSYAIATDYTCIPFWEETNLDYYFIPHKDLMNEFISKGIPKNKLIPTGIPVSSKFNKKLTKFDACKLLSLDPAVKRILIMTGSMGYGDVISTLRCLVRSTTSEDILVLTGHNNDLFADIKHRFKRYPRVKAVPFTADVNLYMDASDITLTKPGGLTSTEAAVKNVPLIHTSPIPGCETRNEAFFHDRGMSICADTPKAITKKVLKLLNCSAKQTDMKNKQYCINANAANDIYQFIKANRKESDYDI